MSNWITHERDKVGDFQKRVLLHIPIGFLIGISWLAHWAVALVLVYVFVRYEENEDKHVKDQAWKDYFGCVIGIILGGMASVAIEVLLL